MPPTDDATVLLRQVLDSTTVLFAKIDKSNEKIAEVVNHVAVLQERQNDDRLTISRVGGELRTCRTGCEAEIKSLESSREKSKEEQAKMNIRLVKVEETSGNRGMIMTFILTTLTSIGLIFAAWKIKG